MLRRDSEMREAERLAPRSLINQRRAGAFVDIDAGEAETRAMIAHKRNKIARYRVRRAADVEGDLDLIEEHLVRTYQKFGEDLRSRSWIACGTGLDG